MHNEDKRFGSGVLTLGKLEMVDRDYAHATTPTRLNVNLFPHQETAVQALLDIEDKRVFPATSGSKVVTLRAGAVVLSEPVGSGKTYIILAMIAHRQIPKAIPSSNNAIVLSGNDAFKRNHYYGYANMSIGMEIPEITIRFNGKYSLIKPNLVIVAPSVLLQWEEAIRQNTNFRVLTIGDLRGMKKFKELLTKNDLHQFQVILMKNGTITGNLDIGAEGVAERKDYMSMIWAISQLTKEYCWSRVFYDDFDTCKAPAGSYLINSLFTVIVSATENKYAPAKKDKIQYKNLADMLESKQTDLSMIIHDRVLFTNFNVRNKDSFTKESTRITILEKYRYVYDNPDDNFIRVMGAIGDEEARETVEALNAGAYGHAAQKWGCESRSAGDIFKRMLDKQYDRYMTSVYILETIEKARNNVKDLPEYPEEKKFKAKVLDQVRGAVIKKTVPTLKYFDQRIMALLDELHLEYTKMKDRDGIAIQRVIENVKEGDCQVCHLPLEGFDVFIVRCCGLIVCDMCGIKGNQIALRYNYKIRANTICGQCANCKADVFPQNDLIYVDQSFDMSGLLKAKGDEQPLAAVEQAVVEEKPEEPKIKNPKLRTLLKIIRGENIPEREVVVTNIKNLLPGTTNIPQGENIKRKVLVFASFDETLNVIEEFFVAQNITYLRLCGTAKQISDTVKNFHTYGSVLLVNSQHYCAGLNLHFATDLVFYHKIINENIESQVAGRIQRIGRTVNGRIHYLCYRNEKNMV